MRRVLGVAAALALVGAAGCTTEPGAPPSPPPAVVGNPDATFNPPTGVIRFTPGESNGVRDATQQADGSIFSVGFAGYTFNRNWWWKLSGVEGAPSGYVRTKQFNAAGGIPHATTPTSDGGHLIVGNGDDNALIVKTNDVGQIDTSFGSGGQVSLDLSPGFDDATDVVVQPDGKILVGLMLDHRYALTIDYGGLGWTVLSMTGPLPHLGVARLNPDGSLDTTFATGGLWEAPAPPDSEVPWLNTRSVSRTSVVLKGDGSMIIAGAASRNLEVAKLTAGGSLDTGWGISGLQRVLADDLYGVIPPNVPGVAVAQIFSGDFHSRPGGGVIASLGQQGFNGSKGDTIALTAAGVLDPSFGGGDGIMDNQVFGDLTSTPSGGFTAVRGSRIYRYDSSGSPDPTFGTGGSLFAHAIYPPQGGLAPPTFTAANHFVQGTGDVVLVGRRTGYVRTIFASYDPVYSVLITRILT